MRILYVDIDSLRPDHLGCYGYGRPTSPVIDGIAGEGVRFTNFYASDSPCVPSRAAMLSGRPGIRNGVVAHEDTPSGCALRYGNPEWNGSTACCGPGSENRWRRPGRATRCATCRPTRRRCWRRSTPTWTVCG